MTDQRVEALSARKLFAEALGNQNEDRRAHDLGVPVVAPIAARIWEIQRRLHVRQPIKGYGSLLETLPA